MAEPGAQCSSMLTKILVLALVVIGLLWTTFMYYNKQWEEKVMPALRKMQVWKKKAEKEEKEKEKQNSETQAETQAEESS